MNLSQFFYEILPLISFIFSILLISLVLRSDWRSFQHRVFALFLLSMGLWGFTIFGMRSSPSLDSAFTWEKVVIAVIPGMPIFFYHFTLLFTRATANRLLLRSFYGLWVIFAILSLTTGLIVSGMEEKSYGHAPVFAALFVPYLAFAYVPTLLGLANLVKRYRASPSPEERNRALYILAGATLSLIGATTDVLAAQEAIPYPLAASPISSLPPSPPWPSSGTACWSFAWWCARVWLTRFWAS